MAEENFVCPFCGAEYETKEGLAKHLKKCDAKPDLEDTDDENTEGVKLFPDDSDDAVVYRCPDCDHRASAPFSVCPKCGCEVDFS